MFYLSIAAAVVTLVPAAWAAFFYFLPNPPPIPPPACQGRQPGGGDSFSISDHYDPSGLMGDIDDIRIERPPGIHRFTYETRGLGKHEWEYTYVRGELNPEPARFGGVMYLSSPNNWAQQPGYDLRNFRHRVRWEARSARGPVNVTFVIGGVSWEWDHVNKQQNNRVPCPDSMPYISRRKTLTEDWQTFDDWDLSEQREEYFSSLIGGFAWMIDWDSNGVRFNEDRTGPAEVKTFIIEIRNIRYER